MAPLGQRDGVLCPALAVGPDGSLYAGGDFTTAGGVAANCIARWDGACVASPGQRMNDYFGYVPALAFGPDGSLYAGGASPRLAGGGQLYRPLGRHGVALPWQRDGRQHFRLSPPWRWAGRSLYAGGDFPTAGGVTPTTSPAGMALRGCPWAAG